MSEAHIRGSLDRFQPRRTLTEEELHRRAQIAWRAHGIVMLKPDEISNEMDRQIVISIATAKYGPRPVDD